MPPEFDPPTATSERTTPSSTGRTRGSIRDICGGRDLPRRQAPRWRRCPAGAWAIRATAAGLPDAEPFAERGWVCGDRLPCQPQTHLARHIGRRQACAGMDQGEHRQINGGDPELVAITGGSAGGRGTVLVAALNPQMTHTGNGLPGCRHIGGCARRPIDGRSTEVSSKGPREGEFIAFLAKFVVKKQVCRSTTGCM